MVAILDTITFAPFPDSLLGGSAPFCQDLRRFITRLNGHLYLWCRCRLAIKSNKLGVSRLNIPQHRSCHETPRPATIYVIIRDGTAKGYLFGVTIYSKSKVDHAGFNSTTLERFAPEYKASCQSKRIHIRSMVTIH